MQEAFTRSLNMPAIQIGLTLGLEKIYEISSRLGLYPQPRDKTIPCAKDEIAGKYCNNYSLLLGAFETTLMQLTSAYTALASGGYQVEPSLISSIYDNTGELLYKNPNLSLFQENSNIRIRSFAKKVITTTVNHKILEMLENALSSQSRELKLKVAGKTGTTNDSFDTWFVGGSKDFTVGVFIGYDLPRSLGKKEIGATVARPVFMHFIRSMLADISDGPIGKFRPAVEMINTGDEIDEDIDNEAVEDLESISEILKKKPEIQLDISDPCPDCEDAFSIRNYMEE
jgi:penicillin-binding protein 1A